MSFDDGGTVDCSAGNGKRRVEFAPSSPILLRLTLTRLASLKD